MILKKRILTVLFAGVAMVSAGADYSHEIAEIKAGTRTEARAVWWGFDAQNATQCLQQAINSGVKKLIVDNVGHDWIIDPVFLTDNQEIVFAKGVKVTARKDGYKGLRDSMFTASGRKNLIIRGEDDVVLLMHKQDYQDAARYKRGEWRHTINLLSCENVKISNLTVKASGGDGIYVGVLPESRINYCNNIVIEDVVCDEHNRQGISVISAKNLLIRHCRLNNTSGTAPAAGIDFEPNRADEIIENCVMEYCTIDSNSGGGILIATEISTPMSLTIRNCTISRGSRGISCEPPGDRKGTNPGVVDIIDTVIRDTANSGILINNHSVSFYRVNFKNVSLINAGTMSGLTPVSLIYTRPAGNKIGNVSFEKVSVKGIPGRELIAFKNWTSGVTVEAVTGIIDLDSRPVNVAEYVKNAGWDKNVILPDAAVIDPAVLMPSGQPRQPQQPSLRMRRDFSLLIWAEKGKPVSFSLNYQNMRSKRGEVPVTALCSGLPGVELGRIGPGQKKDFTFTAPETGICRINFDIDAHVMIFTPSDNLRCSIMGSVKKSGSLSFFRPARNTRLYFEVPFGVKEFKVEVSGEQGETVSAAIIDPSGKVTAEKADFDGPQIFNLTRTGDGREIWCLLLQNAVEDVHVRFIDPLAPVFADSPSNLLVHKK